MSTTIRGTGQEPFVSLQVGSGLRGVTKLKWRGWPHRNWLSYTCAIVFLAAAGLIVAATSKVPDSEPGGLTAVRVGFTIGLGLLVAYRLYSERNLLEPGEIPEWDRRFGDPWWTTLHTLTGVMLGLWMTPFLVLVPLTLAWEVQEISVPGFGDEEINGNRLVDIAVAWLGWMLAAGIAASISDVGAPFLP